MMLTGELSLDSPTPVAVHLLHLHATSLAFHLETLNGLYILISKLVSATEELVEP